MATKSQNKKEIMEKTIDRLEVIHRKDLDDFYSMYAVLRDLYMHISKTSKYSQQSFTIASQIATKVGKKVYNIYKSKIRQGIKTINELLNYRKRYVHYPNPETNGMIINSINSNKEYFHRLIVILDEMFNDKKLDSLIQEIELEKKDLI